MELAQTGAAANADLLVRDIYGGNCDDLGLPGDLVAASLGKLMRPEVRPHHSIAQSTPARPASRRLPLTWSPRC